jgi:hypothetical protein
MLLSVGGDRRRAVTQTVGQHPRSHTGRQGQGGMKMSQIMESDVGCARRWDQLGKAARDPLGSSGLPSGWANTRS